MAIGFFGDYLRGPLVSIGRFRRYDGPQSLYTTRANIKVELAPSSPSHDSLDARTMSRPRLPSLALQPPDANLTDKVCTSCFTSVPNVCPL